MAESIQPTSADKPEDESVLSLQALEGADEEPEVEAHDSTWSVACTKEN